MNAQEAVAVVDRQPLAETSATLAVIARAASDPSVDMDKLERLLAMQERILAKEAEAAFNAAMRETQQEMPRIQKDAKNESTNSRFARLETLNKKIVPVYTKHGFALSYGSADCPIPEHRRVTCRVSHIKGHTRDYFLDLPLDLLGMKGNPNKTQMHAFGSTMSYGRRYLALLIFNISTGEDDDGNQGDDGPEAKAKLRAELWALLKPVRGDARPPTWDIAQRFLWDECVMDPSEHVAELSAEGFRAVIAKVKAKLGCQ